MQKRIIGFVILLATFAALGLGGAQASVGKSARNNYVSGIFVAPEMAPDASAQEWRTAMQNMSRIGIDTVIVQYTFQTDAAYGDQAYFGYWQKDTVNGTGKYPTARNQVGYILEAARQQGIQVYLGLQLAEREWFDKNAYRKYDWLYHQYWLSCDIAGALWTTLGGNIRTRLQAGICLSSLNPQKSIIRILTKLPMYITRR